MTKEELVAHIGRKLFFSINSEEGDVSTVRQNILSRYRGELYGNETTGRSKFVTREVMETVEWSLPPLLRMFLGSNRVVAFEAQGADDEKKADQETEVVNYKVLRANDGDGFLALHNFIKDSLMAPVAYAKVFIDNEQQDLTRQVSGVTADNLRELLEREDVEVKEYAQEEKIIEVDSPDGQKQEIPIAVFDITYKESRKTKKLKIMSVPPEEVLVDNNLTTTNLDEAKFICHRSKKNVTELINMGFDKARLSELRAGNITHYDQNEERYNRYFYEDENPDFHDQDMDKSMRELWVHECYMWVDFDDDGEAEYRRIFVIGDEVFENEEIDYQPIVAMSSILMPHKHIGMSLAELVMDIQKLGTVLTRQLLDNIYSINTRKRFVSEHAILQDGSTMEAIQNTAAQIVPVAGSVRDSVMPDPQQLMLGDLLPVIQYNKEMASLRTGVSPDNAVDPKTLQQTTAGAFLGALDKSGERLELVARILAETGFKQLFRKVHFLCRTHPDIVETVKLRNEWVPISASDWSDRTDVKVNVGIGFSNRQQVVASLMQVLQIQKESMSSGLSDLTNVYHALAKLVESAGLGAPESYFRDPRDEGFQPPPQQPDPQTMALLAQAELFKVQASATKEQSEREKVKMVEELKMKNLEMNQQAAMGNQELQLKQIESQVKTRELGISEQDAELRGQRQEIEDLKTGAETVNIEALTERILEEIGKTRSDAALRDAQAVKALAEARATNRGDDEKKPLDKE